MNSEALQLFEASSNTPGLAEAAGKYLDSMDSAIPRGFGMSQEDWRAESLGGDLVTRVAWNDQVRALLRFLIHLSEGASAPHEHEHTFLIGVLNAVLAEDSKIAPGIAGEIVAEIEDRHESLEHFIECFLTSYARDNCWEMTEEMSSEHPFVNPAANLVYRNVTDRYARDPSALSEHSGLFSALATHKPEITRAWCAASASGWEWGHLPTWIAILEASADYDALCVAHCKTLAESEADDAFRIAGALNEAREGAFSELVLEIATMPKAALGHGGLELLLEKKRDSVTEIMADAFSISEAGNYISFTEGPAYKILFSLITGQWESGGERLLRGVVSNYNKYQLDTLFRDLLKGLGPDHFPVLREAFLVQLEKHEPRDRIELWTVMAGAYPAAFLEDFEQFLTSKSKPLREIAAKVIAAERGPAAIPQLTAQLQSRKADARLGAASFFECLADASTGDVLKEALRVEKSEKVRDGLHKALAAAGIDFLEELSSSESGAAGIEDEIASQVKRLKLPKSSWLAVESLPGLVKADGSEFSGDATVFLIAKQSKQKQIEMAPELAALLNQLDRGRNAGFALQLVEGFLDSDQAAADRWALTLGGLLGDHRIIPPLLSRIQGWCENSRHKLAEYAAQAIALLPGDEPLMVLDTLATRYRSKFKNVGKACAAAFEAAAAARGITPDELGDMVVPSFEFDAEGVRRFEWDGGGISAELSPDFKLQWFDPESEKSWKSMPAFVPDEVKNEVKVLNKMIRETVRGQTARLELGLVRQRRWPVTRWRELFEDHPVLKSFASRLVWGIHDEAGTLLRSFRRYPNGLLADAAGELEELPEESVQIGMIHPLELEADALDAWRAHLSRMKVKPPFPQLDRAVELLDPLHGNRKEIAVSRGKEVGAGTFKSRSEKRGWVRGSVVDAGGISSVYKPFPGVGLEAVLPTENYWIGIDPMEHVVLDAAYFVKSESVDRGSYIYDDPGPDDERVVRFDQVPAIVYSETVADLKAIVGEVKG